MLGEAALAGPVGVSNAPGLPGRLPLSNGEGDAPGEAASDGEAPPSGVAPGRPRPLPLSDGAFVAAGEAAWLSVAPG